MKEKRVRHISVLKQLQERQATLIKEFGIEISLLSLGGFEVKELDYLIEGLREQKKQGLEIDPQSILAEVMDDELSD